MGLKNCPSCDREVKPGDTECACGLVISKWEAKRAAAAVDPDAAAAALTGCAASRPVSGGVGWLAILVVAAALFGGLRLLDSATEEQEEMATVHRSVKPEKPKTTPAGEVRGGELSGKSTEELLRMLKDGELKNPPFDELLKRGAKAETTLVVQTMLRDQGRAVGGNPPQQLKTFLYRLLAPIPYDYYTTGVTPRRGDKGFKLAEWSIEASGSDLSYGVVLYIDEDIAAGFSREPREAEAGFSAAANFRLRIESGALGDPVEKEIEIPRKAGVAQWRKEKLLSGLKPGEYTVTLFVQLQYVDPEGEGRILNDTRQPLRVVIR